MKRLQLEELKVQSFITIYGKSLQGTVRGGTNCPNNNGGDTEDPTATTSCNENQTFDCTGLSFLNS